MLKTAFVNLKHRGDRDGRFQHINTDGSDFSAIVSNTPWIFRDMHLPSVMAGKVTETIGEQSGTDPALICSNVVETLHDFLPLIEDRNAPQLEEEFDARWDMAGELVCVARSGDQLAVARVGDFRVVAVTPKGIEVLLMENTYLAELKARGLVDSLEHPDRYIITAALGGDELPVDLINVAIPEDSKWILAGSSELMDYMPTNPANILTKGSLDESLGVLVEEIRKSWGKTERDRGSTAIMAVQL